MPCVVLMCVVCRFGRVIRLLSLWSFCRCRDRVFEVVLVEVLWVVLMCVICRFGCVIQLLS